MSLFGKRKSGGQLRTLSEKEIQDKLYGSFRVHEQVRFEPSPPPAKQKPVTLQPPHSEPAVSLKELFTTVQEIPTPKIDPSPSRPQLEKKLKEERLSSISEWADEEVENKIKAARLGWEVSQKAREFKAPRPERRPLLKPLQDSLRVAAESFIESLGAFIRSIQFRPADMRRLGYFLAGFSVVLFFLFVIHFLNVRRETAMKMPHPPARPVATEGTNGMVSQAPAKATSLSPATPADREPPASPALNEGEGAYVIQVCTYAGEGDAKRLLTQIHEQRLPGFVKALQRSGAKTYYAVFLGRFKTYQEAQKSLSDFQKKDLAKPFRDAFVRTL